MSKGSKAKIIRVRRGFRMRAVLESISDIPNEIFCAFDAFLSAGYGASSSRFQYELDRSRRDSESLNLPSSASSAKFTKKDLQNYRTMISSLKRDGLIEGKDGKISITSKGKSKLRNLRENSHKLPDPKAYKKPTGNIAVIFAFDVPEKQRVKRWWLRSVLKNLGFENIQRSVFVGKGPLPKEFLADIGKMKLSDTVEIFEVGKKGTLSSYKLK